MTTEPELAPAPIAPIDHPCFDDFVATIAALRAPDGCPWDRAQTHRSIAHNMIEEAYEAVDAIESGKTNKEGNEDYNEQNYSNRQPKGRCR